MDLARPEIAVIDTATDTVLDRIALANTTDPAYKAYYSPDGKWLLTMAGLVDQHLRRCEPPRAAAHADGRRFTDGHRLLGRRQDGARRESRRRHGVCDRHRDRNCHEDFKAGTGIETLTYY